MKTINCPANKGDKDINNNNNDDDDDDDDDNKNKNINDVLRQKHCRPGGDSTATTAREILHVVAPGVSEYVYMVSVFVYVCVCTLRAAESKAGSLCHDATLPHRHDQQ